MSIRCLFLLASFALSTWCVRAADIVEYQVKAAFLLNFTKFAEWPAEAFEAADSPIAICILGEDPFGNSLDQIAAGEAVNGRRIVIRRVIQPPPAKSCHVLFVPATERYAPALPVTAVPGVLTVGEGESFVRDGGVIAFILENRRVRFGINESAATAAGIKLSSKLLNIARFVKK